MFKKTLGASLGIAMMLALPYVASAVVNVTGTPTLGLGTSISGVCGTTPAGSSVSVSLFRTGSTIANLGTVVTTGANGDFSGTFAVPNNIGGGPVTVVANCPNGNTFSVNSSIFDPLANVTVGDTTPRIGTGFTVAGVCGTTAGGTVTFLLSNPNSQIVIGSTTTAANGSFSSTLTIPTNFPTGSATLVGFCPTGNIMTTAVVVDPSATGGTITLPPASTDTGAVGGVSTTPTGGVAAGRTQNTLALAGLLFILLSAAGLVLTKKLQAGYDL